MSKPKNPTLSSQFRGRVAVDIQRDTPTGYESLAEVLDAALDQAASGKGKERHANDLPFDKQPMQSISGLLHGPEGLIFQAIKKSTEANGLRQKAILAGTDLAQADAFFEKEVLGAINYLAGALVFVRNAAKARA